MDVNDNAGSLNARGVYTSIASRLAPTVGLVTYARNELDLMTPSPARQNRPVRGGLRVAQDDQAIGWVNQ